MQIRIIIFRKDETIREYKKKVDQDKDEEDVPKLESVEVVLVHCNLKNNSYQQASKVLFTFVPNKQFGLLINISSHSLTMLDTTNAEFSFIEVCFTDQNSDTNYWSDIIKIRNSTEPKFRKYIKGYSFLSFARKFGDTATKAGIDAAKTASKRVVQKTAEATADLIGDKIADKITSLGKTKSKKKEKEEGRQEIYIPPEKRQQVIDELRLFLNVI